MYLSKFTREEYYVLDLVQKQQNWLRLKQIHVGIAEILRYGMLLQISRQN